MVLKDCLIPLIDDDGEKRQLPKFGEEDTGGWIAKQHQNHDSPISSLHQRKPAKTAQCMFSPLPLGSAPHLFISPYSNLDNLDNLKKNIQSSLKQLPL